MSTTNITMKGGVELEGTIQDWHPELGWFSIWNGFEEQKILLNNVLTAVTPSVMVSISKIIDRDELQRAKDDLAAGRENKWKGFPEEQQDWE